MDDIKAEIYFNRALVWCVLFELQKDSLELSVICILGWIINLLKYIYCHYRSA